MPRQKFLPVLVSILLVGLVLAGCWAGIAHSERRPITDRVNASPRDASLNLVDLPALDEPSYRFLVVGHAYGTIQGEDREPARALLDAIPEMKEMGLSLLVSLGDMVKQSDEDDFDALDEMLLEPLPFPVFNTVGNHDVEDRALYESRYGATYYSFRYGPSRMIFLDTERAACAIDEPQREMLAQALQAAVDDEQAAHIFIFLHKTLFFHNERLFELKKEKAAPNVWDCYGAGNFAALLDELIEPAAAQKPVYLFAGDVGAFANLSPYYEQAPGLPLTMLMTGLGDFPSDAGILVSVNGPDVTLEAYSLTGQEMPALQTYTPEYWIGIAE